ncbi:hypothetical protein L1987_46625 [Smallanthus sonchifolius]|uniref:Uncharacterized protein n=1 Tax=Smallanthus sonchifolius TaxID=185202 RepID=A0ACB9G0D2_9ASTR|nr:hypothetical protein L1987_46625 [Smallanthus sonchifolius]
MRESVVEDGVGTGDGVGGNWAVDGPEGADGMWVEGGLVVCGLEEVEVDGLEADEVGGLWIGLLRFMGNGWGVGLRGMSQKGRYEVGLVDGVVVVGEGVLLVVGVGICSSKLVIGISVVLVDVEFL